MRSGAVTPSFRSLPAPSFSGGLPSAIQEPSLPRRALEAGHRKTAIFGWLAFVIISVFIAGAVGQQTIADEDYGNGESKAADKAIAGADFRDAAEEQVLVQGKGSVKIGDPQPSPPP